MRKLFILMFLCSATVAVSGCISSSPNADFYTLMPVKTQQQPLQIKTTSAENSFDIGVETIYIPAYLDKSQIITRSQDGIALKISELNRWAEPVARNIQRVLAQDIGYYSKALSAKPLVSRQDVSDYVVKVEISNFDAFEDGRIKLEAWFQIIDGVGENKGDVLAKKKFSLEKPYKAGDYKDMVKVQSEMLSLLAYAIAKAIEQQI